MENRKEGKLDTIIGKTTKVNGEIKSKGTLRVDGHFEGKIETEDTFLSGKDSYIKGDIYCKHAYIGGKVEGNVYSQDKVELHSGAYLKGDVICRGIVIEDNVFFEGKCSMSKKNTQ